MLRCSAGRLSVIPAQNLVAVDPAFDSKTLRERAQEIAGFVDQKTVVESELGRLTVGDDHAPRKIPIIFGGGPFERHPLEMDLTAPPGDGGVEIVRSQILHSEYVASESAC